MLASFSTLRRVYRWCNYTERLNQIDEECFSTLRRVYRWCNRGETCISATPTVVSVPSDGSTGGVTLAMCLWMGGCAMFQYPQTGLQVV